jgi:hypothetical protein
LFRFPQTLAARKINVFTLAQKRTAMEKDTHTHTTNNGPSVLFFGKHNCQYSQQALEHLKH